MYLVVKRPLDRAILLWRALVVACDGDEADALDTLLREAPQHDAKAALQRPEHPAPRAAGGSG